MAFVLFLVLANIFWGAIISGICYLIYRVCRKLPEVRVLDPKTFVKSFILLSFFSVLFVPRALLLGELVQNIVLCLSFVIFYPGLQRLFPRPPSRPRPDDPDS